jgi:hypothetical protein
LFDDVTKTRNIHVWFLSKASFAQFTADPSIRVPFNSAAGVFYCGDQTTLHVVVQDGFFGAKDITDSVDGVVGFQAFDTLRTFTHEVVHAMQQEAHFSATNDGYYWVEGSANLIAEQVCCVLMKDQGVEKKKIRFVNLIFFFTVDSENFKFGRTRSFLFGIISNGNASKVWKIGNVCRSKQIFDFLRRQRRCRFSLCNGSICID